MVIHMSLFYFGTRLLFYTVTSKKSVKIIRKYRDFSEIHLQVGGRDKRAVTELGFAHVNTKSWSYLGVFGFFRFLFVCL